jgi:MFS family permease
LIFSDYLQEIGCLVGALSNLWVGDWLGRRKTIFVGGVIMIIGAILQAASVNYAMMIVARIVTGLGNGLNASLKLPFKTGTMS